ncbi:TniQ family protein [Rhizobium binxianense]|uniref:TniQ family protein n=1 Tax=Rhizobium binxianense TaxID=3024242 RepID=UPI0023628FE7|nr:TniQ family protein [Rhizobium sp. MJ37]MDC9835713.1 TniQ family protein [Rhizobium sp. MJ37]
MSRLFEIINFNAGETVASYCSRLAAACGYRHARSFGADLGFLFQGVAIGSQEDIEKFAAVVGVPVSYLAHGIVTTDDRINIVAGQSLTRTFMQRQRLRFCPLCVFDDERQKGGRRGFRSFGRVDWLVKSIRCCEVHHVQLVTSEHAAPPMFIHDFAANLAQFGDVGGLVSNAEFLKPDRLQRYVKERLRGHQTEAAWLDSLPLYAAVRLCETVGATERHGTHFYTSSFDEREWSACADAGYDLLRGGENDFREHLRGQITRFYGRLSDMGGRSIFGRLYERIAHETDDKAYDPIRSIMRDIALDNLPLGPGDEFFGPVNERRLHSVQSASIEFGIHPKRLRKTLVNEGLIPVEDQSKTFERILLDAETMEKFALETKRSLDVPDAKAHLNAERVQFEMLVKHGLIGPLGGNGASAEIAVERRFSPSDLDSLLRRLQAAVTRADHDGLCDLRGVMKKAGCSFVEVIELVLGGTLTTVAWNADETGLAAVRLDASEIKARTLGDDHGCFSLHQLQMLIPASTKIIKALIESGRLPAVQRRNPVKRNMQTVVEPDSLKAFMDEYLSLGNFATRRKTRTWNLKRDLDDAGIEPIFVAAEMPFYLKSDIERM